MKIAVFPNALRDTAFTYTKQLITHIRRKGGVSLMLPEMKEHVDLPGVKYVESLHEDADLLICLGGDGTFLSSLNLPGWQNVPTIGVNLGSVGFLPQIMPERLEAAIDQLFAREYVIEERMMLSATAVDAGGRVIHQQRALNDIVLGRGLSGRIVTISLQIDEEMVERVPGDGLIVSSPTGSTAYALSAGGPIVHPGVQLLLITPICPHSLHNRSYIASEDSYIRLSIDWYPEPAIVSVDGQTNFPLSHGEYLDIRRAEDVFRLIRLGGNRFYETLSAKIQQRGTTA
ncbi:MAG TPA: NAD(+)/NADH kinase [Fastidiosipila sp.]|jgi:NAD+ kinase|nr:NAD(+)/NADH kinase [Fastidiosipila sp.]